MNKARWIDSADFLYQWVRLSVALLTLGGFIGYTQFKDHQRIDTQEQERLTIQAEIIEKNVAPQLLLANRVIEDIIKDLPSWRAERDDYKRGNRQLQLINDALIGIRPILVIQADGKVIASSDEKLIGMNFAYRDYFKTAVKNPDPNILHVSAPFKTVLNAFVFSLFRSISGPHGEFAGIVIVSVVPEYFSILLDSVRYAPDMLSAIIHGDGKMFLMLPNKPVAGIDLARPGTLFTRHRESGKKTDVFSGMVYATGEYDMMAMRTIQLSTPTMDKALVVAVGRDLDVLFAPWRRTAYVQSILFGVITIFSALWLFITQKRQRGHRAERKREEEEKTKLEDLLQQAQKMESIGRLAGGVAHDFNNMLTVILGHTNLALMTMEPAQPLYVSLEEIRKAAERSADLTRQLLAFARKQAIVPKVLDVNETVVGTLNMLQRLVGEDIRLAWQPGINLWPVKVDPSQVDQILANLCVNARDAIADVGRIAIETENCTFDTNNCAIHVGAWPGDFVRLAVSDDGSGMDKETLAHIFEPFFTAKGAGKGTGLGLATVYGIVKQNNGFINVYSEPGLGTTFTIYLPRHEGEASHLLREHVAEPPPQGHETILLVEDERAILRITAMMLENLGYTVVVANTPDEAISLIKKHANKIHLLLTDVVMPEMNGRDLTKKLLSLHPQLKSLFMSGYTSNVIGHHGVLEEGVNFIEKPFSMQDLATKVREVLDSK